MLMTIKIMVRMILATMVTRVRTAVETHLVQTLVILIMMMQLKILPTIQVDLSQVMTNPKVTKMMMMLTIRLYRLRFINNSHQTLEKVLNRIKMKKTTLRQN